MKPFKFVGANGARFTYYSGYDLIDRETGQRIGSIDQVDRGDWKPIGYEVRFKRLSEAGEWLWGAHKEMTS
jgi:hypothetical protein